MSASDALPVIEMILSSRAWCASVSLCGGTQVTVMEIMGNHLFFKSIASQVEKNTADYWFGTTQYFLPCI